MSNENDSSPPQPTVDVKQEIQTRSSSSAGVEEEIPPAKRIKLEPETVPPATPVAQAPPSSPPTTQTTESKSLVSPEQQPDVPAEPPASTTTTTTTTTSPASTGAQPGPAPAPASAPAPPLKAVTMVHLKTKYSGELEYMLREFRKLERQLLGAKGTSQMEESAGSRERREKLHTFILHLEDTIRQIELGCQLEAEGKSTLNISVTTNASAAAQGQQALKDNALAGSNLTKEKEEEENVQKIEEHILASLLPVKVRLKKQLAAQQGATKNPAGAPVTRRGMLKPSETQTSKGTFAAAAELKRKQQVEASMMVAAQQQSPAEPVHPDQTQFGKPLGQRGSSLTQKLHGPTLGSKGRTHGHGVGTAKPTSEEDTNTERKIMYGGVAPGSKQVVQGVAVASSVHKMVLHSPQPTSEVSSNQKPASPTTNTTTTATTLQHPPAAAVPSKASSQSKKSTRPTSSSSEKDKLIKQKLDDPTLTEEERKQLRRKLKKKKLIRRAKRRDVERQRQVALQNSAGHPGAPGGKVGSGSRKKGAMGITINGKTTRGPRTVEYLCALCSEAYTSVCEYNPWWALAQHECPKCRKLQVSEDMCLKLLRLLE